MKKPLMLIIMDGYGISDSDYGNAIAAANTPNLDRIFDTSSGTTIGASGLNVGLPDGQMGNSEVGHTNMGAGRVVYQELTRITKSIKDGEFSNVAALSDAMDACKEKGTSLHLMGLLSDGGVHSHIDHLFGLLDMAVAKGLKDIVVHCFMDGRDVPPTSGIEFVEQLQKKLKDIGAGKIGTINGRYYAMDRDNRWDRVELAYNAMVLGEGNVNINPVDVMDKSYTQEVTDEFIIPTVCSENTTVSKDDSVIFFNFRPDRARELTRTFVDPDFDGFERKKGYFPVNFVCMTQYDVSMPNVDVAFAPQSLVNTFGEYIADKGLSQLRIAETEKYAHVTFFFNGGVEEPYKNEDRALIPSPKVATYDMQPEMSAPAVTKECVKRIESGKYDVIILNYANCDMVGHTGVFDAAVAAVEAVDTGLGEVVAALDKMDGSAFITADHGNADKMFEEDASPFTAHTTNPVPFIAYNMDVKLSGDGKLADIAPTMLDALGLDVPSEMTGTSLIIK